MSNTDLRFNHDHSLSFITSFVYAEHPLNSQWFPTVCDTVNSILHKVLGIKKNAIEQKSCLIILNLSDNKFSVFLEWFYTFFYKNQYNFDAHCFLFFEGF